MGGKKNAFRWLDPTLVASKVGTQQLPDILHEFVNLFGKDNSANSTQANVKKMMDITIIDDNFTSRVLQKI
jgi:hypothetical protein